MKSMWLLMLVIASGVMTSGCAFSGSTQSIAPILPPPLECVQRCPEPPPMALKRELWEAETLHFGLACRKLHNDCVDGITPPR